MNNINERCPLSTGCGRKKCEFKFKENECKYYYGNATNDVNAEDVPSLDILDYFNDEGDERQLRYIDIGLIHNHPDNPRKDVGDVTELAESIKHSGIMQNLTVVPFGEEYRVIIGHRRLAAAKVAGLTELPCVVVEMSEKEQLATMLSENMQRVDLTVVEQAQGMQLMLDMGESVAEISKKTGLSKATVGKRVKIATLPSDKLKAAESRGGTIEDYLKCLEIEDEGKRAELLEKVGTRDFSWNYSSYINAQKKDKILPLIIAKCEELGIKPFPEKLDRYSSKVERVGSVHIISWDGEDIPMSKGENYYFVEQMYVYIYKKAPKAKPVKKSEKEIEAERRRKELKELSENAFRLREEFVLNFSEPKKYEKVILEYLIKFSFDKLTVYYNQDLNIIKKAIGDDSSGYYPNQEKVKNFMQNDTRALLILAYYTAGDSSGKSCYSNNWGKQYPSYSKSRILEDIYEFLSKLGYQISTEEQKLLDGTHELYAVDDEGE